MPSIATSTGSGAVPGSAPPTAWTMRPQFGSPPCSAAFTSGELATARARRLDALGVPAADEHARRPARRPRRRRPSSPRAGAAARRAPRRSAARPRSRARRARPLAPRAQQDRRVVGRELAVDGGAVEGALDATRRAAGRPSRPRAPRRSPRSRASSRSAARSCRRPCTARSGAPCRTAARPRGSRASRSASVVWIACWKAPSPSRREAPRASRMPFSTASHVSRYWLIPPVEASATSSAWTPGAAAAAPCVLAASSSPRRPVAALAQPEFDEHRAQRIELGSARGSAAPAPRRRPRR